MTLDDMINKLKENPLIQGVVIEKRYLSELVEFVQGTENCANCNGLDACLNKQKGFKPYLVKKDYWSICYKQCKHLSKLERALEKNELHMINSGDYTFNDFKTHTIERKRLLEYGKKFVDDLTDNKKPVGLFINGEYSSGKTFYLKCLSTELLAREINNIVVFTSDFARIIKGAINNGTLEEKVEALKSIPVLMFDDLGGELMSPWLRDEVFLPIINHRESHALPTFYTSNLTFESLVEHFATTKNDYDNTKALRLVERVKRQTLFITLKTKYSDE